MPWPMDWQLFIYFQTGAFICVQVSIPKCHGQQTGNYLFISRQVDSSMSMGAFPNAMANGAAFIYLFPPSCIHPCPSEHSRMPWLTDLYLFIYFQTGAFIHVQVSIPECHGRRTGIYLFISGQVHSSMSRGAFLNTMA